MASCLIDVNQTKARQIAKKLCEFFELPYIKLWYVDQLEEYAGFYFRETRTLSAFVLIDKYDESKLATLLHELSHHLQYIQYDTIGHGMTFIRSRKRVAAWALRNISDEFDWNYILKNLEPFN